MSTDKRKMRTRRTVTNIKKSFPVSEGIEGKETTTASLIEECGRSRMRLD